MYKELIQIYEKNSNRLQHINHLNFTKDSDLLELILSLSAESSQYIFLLYSNLSKRCYNIKTENLVSRVTLNVKDIAPIKGSKRKLIKELKSIDFLFEIKKDVYMINICYINPFSQEQTLDFLNYLKYEAFKERY